MTRTIITLSDGDKEWLEHYSHTVHQSIAQTIRMAITLYRGQQKVSARKEMLSRTAGLWRGKRIDTLRYVKNLRKEW